MRGDEKRKLQQQLADLLGVPLEDYYARFDNGLTMTNLRNWIAFLGSVRHRS
jgi:hypothetical protein